MATNHVQGQIETWAHTMSGASVVSGGVVEMADVTGVALGDIADGVTGSVAVTGTFSLPKDGATAFTQGAEVEWNGTIVIAKAAGTRIGFVSKPAASADPTMAVRLER